MTLWWKIINGELRCSGSLGGKPRSGYMVTPWAFDGLAVYEIDSKSYISTHCESYMEALVRADSERKITGCIEKHIYFEFLPDQCVLVT